MGRVEKQTGDRVGAILSADENEVKFLGYGVYSGDEVPPDFPIKNPKLTLDDGSVVWGYQCWWGPEETIKRMIGDKKVVIVKIREDGDE